jgi:formylglycine-generating enzyme required for sulfatase activity
MAGTLPDLGGHVASKEGVHNNAAMTLGKTMTWALCLLPLAWTVGCVDSKKRPGDGGAGNPYEGSTATKVPGNFKRIKKGMFWMGSPKGEPCREQSDGTPTYKETRHQVTLSRDFQMQTTEVNQGQFKSVMGYNPSEFYKGGGLSPVEKVTWHEAASYCNALSALAGLSPCYQCAGAKVSTSCANASPYNAAGGGKPIQSCPGYRLPTEAEWEYAYRAGTQTSLYTNKNMTQCGKNDPEAAKIGWFRWNRPKSVGTMQSATRQANPWGLFDLPGNVREWTQDVKAENLGSAKVTDPVTTPTSPGAKVGVMIHRGGGWLSEADELRAAARMAFWDNDPNSDIGFRVVRTMF